MAYFKLPVTGVAILGAITAVIVEYHELCQRKE